MTSYGQLDSNESATLDVRMSRARLYVLIDSFEHDMRTIVEKNLLVEHADIDILTQEELTEVTRRRARDENSDDVSLVHYMDLGATFDLLMRHKDDLPYLLTTELKEIAPRVPCLIPIRHRVMHGRPLNADDALNAISILTEFTSRYWPTTKETVKKLRQDPTWEPYFERLSPTNERVVHNLPEVDYDETTFIGRKAEAEKLLRDLKRRRDAVITVIGEGGIGKTALALDVAYRLLDSPDNPYEAILWVSLKTERLTAHGVEEIRDAINGVPESIIEIGQGISSDFSGSLEDLALALDGIECLIVIDNLESIRGDEVIEMYDKLPTSVNYLFTSRVGIGQLERTFKLPPLDNKESKLLLRKFAAARSQRTILRMSDNEMTNTVTKLRNSPLAIRWYVLSAESGRVPLEVVSDQQALLDFCVKNVYERISDNAQVVANILRALDRAIGFNEFSVLTTFGIDELRRATQELNRGSLVSVEADPAGSAAGKLVLTETARTFLPRPDVQGRFISEILRREQEFREAIRSGGPVRNDRIDTTRVWVSDENDRPAMFLLNRALRLAKSGQYAAAHKDIERAQAFSPEYSEVHRASGHVHRLDENFGTAVEKFKHALRCATGGHPEATASFELASVLAKQMRDTELALPHAHRAYELLPCNPTALLLGRILTWSGEFEDGQRYIEDAIEGASDSQRLIAYTALIDNLARWSDSRLKSTDYSAAFDKSGSGIHLGLKILSEFPRDLKLNANIGECALLLVRSSNGFGRRGVGALKNEVYAFREMIEFLDRSVAKVPFNKRRLLLEAVETAVTQRNHEDEVRILCARTTALLSPHVAK
ncbi:NB-ARC domain-containing protein [Nocardia sp. NPDC051990]|uniref:NB-ARC domain-containing protein n=1 Tax=Nocardia sp. NPDC051990 TaxID=3155285 RepID=UPI003424DBE5